MPRSSRLAAHRQANGKDPNGLPLAAGNSTPRRFDNFMERVRAPLPGSTSAKASGATAPSFARVNAKAPAQRAAPKPATPKPAAKQWAPSAAEQARSRAEARHNAVMSSPLANGRRAAAKALLNAKENYSVAQILAALPGMSTDAQLAEKAKREASDGVWGRAWNGRSANTAPKPSAQVSSSTPARGRAAADAVWERAYRSAGAETNDAKPSGAAPEESGKAAADAVWDLANAAVGRVKKEG